MNKKYYLIVLSLLGAFSTATFAEEKEQNFSLYMDIPEYYTVLDTKIVQELTSRQGKFKINDLSPYSRIQLLFDKILKEQPSLTNYKINKNKLNKWKREMKFGFGGPSLKYESIKDLKLKLKDPKARYILLMMPGVKFLSRVSVDAVAYYGSGIIYDSATIKLFSSYNLCVIDLKTESTLECEEFFTTSLFNSNNEIDTSRLAEIKEYIELDIKNKIILERINILLGSKDTTTLNGNEFKQLYKTGLQENGFSIDEITDRSNYLTELVNQPAKPLEKNDLLRLENRITESMVSMLEKNLPNTIHKLIDFINNHNHEPEDL